jgi:predicted phosphodiesterase
MLKILVMSDLHTESEPFDLPLPKNPDLVLLAGDIGYGAAGITFARTYFPANVPVAVIAGNHEFFHGEVESVIELCGAEAGTTKNVFFLENDEVVLPLDGGTVRVLGCVLWTDYQLLDDEEGAFDLAASRLPDFRLIRYRQGALTPEITAGLHFQSREWLRARLHDKFDGKTIVLTHHAPSPMSQHPAFLGDALSPAYVSDLRNVILDYQPDLWVHGHTHWAVDYRHGRTRVYSNQLGFPKQDAGFRLELIQL